MFINKDILTSGVVISNGSGVINVQGFMTAFVGEVFEINISSSVKTLGIVVNLYRDETMNLIIGALLVDINAKVGEGAKLSGTSKLLTIVLGDFTIGSILDAVGTFILNDSKINVESKWLVESPAPGIIDRQSVCEPLQTGIMSIDAMIPIGRGQRELIVGDRQSGKTSICIDTILNQKSNNVICVYNPVGAKASSVLEVFISLTSRNASEFTSFIIASASSSACSQYLSTYTAVALCEYFCVNKGLPAFIVYDDLSRHAVAYRELSLLLRRPPGREAYPGEIFFVHSRLLERAVKLNDNLGGGSITAFPVIETLAGDVSGYITTNVISITDGQIFLSTELFLSGVKPAVDVGLSVSRVGSAAQNNEMRIVAGSYKLELAQFVELQSFSQFASDLGEETKQRLDKGNRLVELLKQENGSPINVIKQVILLSLANQDVISKVSLSNINKFVNFYLSVPIWLQEYIPARLLGLSIAKIVNKN